VHFLIAPEENIMAIDNQPMYIADMSSVATNISIIAYNCSNGVGMVEYNDRLKLFDSFSDMSPYIPFFNQWLVVAETFTSMPLTLPQAKYVKIGLTEATFNSKRQAPIAFAGFNWDASDPAVVLMQNALATWDVAAAASAADAQLAANVSGMTIDTQTTFTGSGGSISAVSTSTHSAVGAPGPVTGPTVKWPTYPSPPGTLVNLTMSAMRSLIAAINQRMQNLNTVRTNKETAINHLTTIADVIAYSVLSGW
jgi:hypothetical protein